MISQLAEMMDPEDLEYLRKNAARGKAYQIQNSDKNSVKSTKRALEQDSDDENDTDDEGFEDFEKNAVKRIKLDQDEENSGNKTRNLLPVRSREGGWEKRTVDVKNDNSEDENDFENDVENENDFLNEDKQEDAKIDEPVSVIHILAKRKKLIEETKVQIGSMATNFLENPEERMFLLEKLIKFMTLGQNDPSVESTVIKLASASVLEIFKDIIPSYKIADHEENDKNVKLKKDTLKLHKYETALLGCVKRFLVKCERIVSENKKSTLAPHALSCMMNLLVAHPEFNFTENVIQFTVPYLNCPFENLRQIAKQGLDQVFKNDKRGQVSYLVVRSINHHLKTKKRDRIKPEMLNVLLSLKLYHLENTKDIATAHLEAMKKGKKKREEMSKKERKMAKQRAKLG